MSAFPKKILIVRLGALGDVVNALVLAAAIKRAHPEVQIGWAVHGLSYPIVEGNPVVDRAHLWDKRHGAGGLLACLREVRAERYDLAIDLARIFKSALVARFSGASRVLGFDRARTKEFAWLFLKESVAPRADFATAHMVDQYMEFARHLGVEELPHHSLPQDPEAEVWAARQVEAMGAAPIGIGIGASYVSKRWPAERFLALARAARERFDLPVVLLGGPSDRESAASELDTLAKEPDPGIVNLVGRTSMAELISMAGRVRVFVSCDTGPMHLAVARGRRVVALFGPGVAGRTGPYNPASKGVDDKRHQIVRMPPECAPCNKRTCRMERHACMLDIEVIHVLDAIALQLAATDRYGGELVPRQPSSQEAS